MFLNYFTISQPIQKMNPIELMLTSVIIISDTITIIFFSFSVNHDNNPKIRDKGKLKIKINILPLTKKLLEVSSIRYKNTQDNKTSMLAVRAIYLLHEYCFSCILDSCLKRFFSNQKISLEHFKEHFCSSSFSGTPSAPEENESSLCLDMIASETLF